MFVSNGLLPSIIPEIPTAIMLVFPPPLAVFTPVAVIVSEVMLEAPTLPHHSSTVSLPPWLYEALRAQLKREVSLTPVERALSFWVIMTIMTSLLLQFFTTTLTVVDGEAELALAKQSSPFTKFAVTVPPPLTVRIVVDDVILPRVIDAVLDVQAVKV
jgi:hypothetical protein